MLRAKSLITQGSNLSFVFEFLKQSLPTPKRVRNDLYYQLPLSTNLLYAEVLKKFHKNKCLYLGFFYFCGRFSCVLQLL